MERPKKRQRFSAIEAASKIFDMDSTLGSDDCEEGDGFESELS